MSKKYKVIMIVAVISLLLIAGGVTYAYFTAGITGVESASTIVTTGGIMHIDYSEGNENISVSNIYPRANAWVTRTFTVTGTNTTDLTMKYKVGIEVASNTFVANALTYDLTNTLNEGGTPITNVTAGVIGTTGATQWMGTGSFGTLTDKKHTYRIDVYFKDSNANQNANQGASLSAKIVIDEAGTEEAPAPVTATYFGWGSESSTLAGADTRSKGFTFKKTDSTLFTSYDATLTSWTSQGWSSSSSEAEIPFVCAQGVTPGTEVCVNYKTTDLSDQCTAAGGTMSSSTVCALGSFECDVTSSGADCGGGNASCSVIDFGYASCYE